MLVAIDGRRCSMCKVVKPFTDYHRDRSDKSGVSCYCKLCANTRARIQQRNRIKDPEYLYKRRDAYIKRTHGITAEEYDEKLENQGYRCAICSVSLPARGSFTHLDHDHDTGELRDFLCTNCNRGLGHFQDNYRLLEKAVKYLEKHSE